GHDHSLALRADGTIAAWGRNEFGQVLGYPTLQDFHQIGGFTDVFSTNGIVTLNGQALTNICGIAAGWAHSIGLRADGTVAAWGNNDFGQTNVPCDLTNVIAIAAGY